jgi:hypothetical protein
MRRVPVGRSQRAGWNRRDWEASFIETLGFKTQELGEVRFADERVQEGMEVFYVVLR